MNEFTGNVDFKNKRIAANIAEYAGTSHGLNFMTPEKAMAADLLRENLIKGIGQKLQWAYSRTKPFLRDLSPGCRICGSGAWSCLFINGKCNCRCFYCPTSQDEISIPTTNRLLFEKSTDYSDYVRNFDFQGISISGGEPLMTFDRTLEYITKARKKGPENLHIWMYTNGSLLTVDHLLKLKDAGLNEIRFDIGATGYDLKKLFMAVGKIPVVTVEIPAVPEDVEKLSELIPIMTDAGVNYLNLHQLRMTPHNSQFMSSRPNNYTFLHGDKVTVLESELAVLSLLARAIEKGWNLPIHYCSFTYKNQFQKAGTRKRFAGFVIKPFESVTESGFIRSICLKGESDIIQFLCQQLKHQNISPDLYQISGNKTRMTVHESLWSIFEKSRLDIQLNYHEAVLSQGLSYHHAFKEIRLDGGMNLFVEKQPRLMGSKLTPGEIRGFENRVLQKNHLPDSHGPVYPWEEYERIQEGLQGYY